MRKKAGALAVLLGVMLLVSVVGVSGQFDTGNPCDKEKGGNYDGKNMYQPGFVFGESGQRVPDRCDVSAKSVIEVSCSQAGYILEETMDCPKDYKCVQFGQGGLANNIGAFCVPTASEARTDEGLKAILDGRIKKARERGTIDAQTPTSCVYDSDGSNARIGGLTLVTYKTTLNGGSYTYIEVHVDECLSDSKVNEKICSQNGLEATLIQCPDLPICLDSFSDRCAAGSAPNPTVQPPPTPMPIGAGGTIPTTPEPAPTPLPPSPPATTPLAVTSCGPIENGVLLNGNIQKTNFCVGKSYTEYVCDGTAYTEKHFTCKRCEGNNCVGSEHIKNVRKTVITSLIDGNSFGLAVAALAQQLQGVEECNQLKERLMSDLLKLKSGEVAGYFAKPPLTLRSTLSLCEAQYAEAYDEPLVQSAEQLVTTYASSTEDTSLRSTKTGSATEIILRYQEGIVEGTVAGVSAFLIVIVVSFVAGFFFGKELQHKKDGRKARKR